MTCNCYCRRYYYFFITLLFIIFSFVITEPVQSVQFAKYYNAWVEVNQNQHFRARIGSMTRIINSSGVVRVRLYVVNMRGSGSEELRPCDWYQSMPPQMSDTLQGYIEIMNHLGRVGTRDINSTTSPVYSERFSEITLNETLIRGSITRTEGGSFSNHSSPYQRHNLHNTTYVITPDTRTRDALQEQNDGVTRMYLLGEAMVVSFNRLYNELECQGLPGAERALIINAGPHSHINVHRHLIQYNSATRWFVSRVDGSQTDSIIMRFHVNDDQVIDEIRLEDQENHLTVSFTVNLEFETLRTGVQYPQ